MNGMNNSNDDVVECPLCMEPLEVDDLNFFPCTCGYQICRFCWHRIRTDENELCPACRKEYPENPADFTPLTQEEMIAFKSQKRQRDQQRKQKITENRKHLANVRVVQKNLVFVVGLPPRLADADILKKHEYFGKYGKIHKVVINPSTAYAGVQGPSASAYVTYVSNSDALRAIQSVNNIMIDGRLIKTSLGTTKYCSHFMKNQQCPKGDCMYLHELGDPEASFTKEEMHQGKHQEYEKRLHDALIAISGTATVSGMGQPAVVNGLVTVGLGSGNVSGSGSSKSSESSSKGGNTSAMSASSSSSTSSSSSASSAASGNGGAIGATNGVAITSGGNGGGQQTKDAWPSLSTSPVQNKEMANGTSRSKKEKSKHDKAKGEKNIKTKSKNVSKDQQHSEVMALSAGEYNSNSGSSNKSKNDKHKEKVTRSSHREQQQQQLAKEKCAISADEEMKQIEAIEQGEGGSSNKGKAAGAQRVELDSNGDSVQGEEQRSLSSSSSISCSSSSSDSASGANSKSSDHSSLMLSESTSGKSSPGSLPDCTLVTEQNSMPAATQLLGDSGADEGLSDIEREVDNQLSTSSGSGADLDTSGGPRVSPITGASKLPSPLSVGGIGNTSSNLLDATAALSKFNFFDDSNSFFSTSAGASLQQSLLHKGKQAAEMRQQQLNSNLITSKLPDLLNGIDGYQSNSNTNDWEEAYKSILLRTNSKQLEEHMHQQQLQQQFQHQQQQQLQQQEEFLRMQELQKRKSFLSNMSLSQLNGSHNDFSNVANNYHNSNDLSRLSQAALMQQQQQQLLQQQHNAANVEHMLGSSLFGTNMSKFFDFHKNQQQIHQYLVNGHSSNPLTDQLRMASIIDSNRVNSQFVEPSNGLLTPQQKQMQQQRLLGKFDSMQQQSQGPQSTQNNNQQQASQQQQQQQQQQQREQSARHINQFTQNSSSVDDDLGFDPFIETQKALAELMENEVVQQQQNLSVAGNTTSGGNNGSGKLRQQQHQQIQQQHQLMENMQRTRMPPPGFNHMNAFGFGVPRAQNTSKIMPFMNMPGNNGGPAAAANNPQLTPQQQLQMSGSWGPQISAFQQQQQQLGESIANPIHKGYNDWTAMDPAILSYRQFASFPQPQQQMPPHPQQQQQDMFMQHMSQQQQHQAGFGAPAQHGGVNLPNPLLNTQQPSQAQVNFSHSNWLNTEQTLFMNSLTNGYAGNTNPNSGFEKFTLPMAGMHQSNLNKQQKTECIN